MKINIITDGTEKNYIIGYTIKPFNPDLPNIEITEDDLPYLMTQKCRAINNKLVRDEAELKVIANKNRTAYENEYDAIHAWFKRYDEQVIQYNRHIRLHGESDIDIASLDAEAEVKAARLKELEALL